MQDIPVPGRLEAGGLLVLMLPRRGLRHGPC
jgi:hypothetical protein